MKQHWSITSLKLVIAVECYLYLSTKINLDFSGICNHMQFKYKRLNIANVGKSGSRVNPASNWLQDFEWIIKDLCSLIS